MGIFDRHHQNKADAARDIAAASRHQGDEENAKAWEREAAKNEAKAKGAKRR
jgi:hypothetical protein